MSGHSKWSTIKHKKAAQDSKRGKVFGEIGRQIRVAVKENGSGDPDQNPALRTALEKARAANMPKANIDRAIQRGLGKTADGVTLEEVVYEGYAPGGVGMMVYVVTDNRNRSGSEVRSIIEKAGGSLGGPGSTAYLFDVAAGGTQVSVKVPMPVDEAAGLQVEKLVDSLQGHDDVEMVVTNMADD